MSMWLSFVKKWLRKLFLFPTSIEMDVINDSDDYEESHDKCFSKINKEVLFRITKEKDCDALRKAGGVEAVALALKSDFMQGIDGDSEDLRIRREVLGSNTYLETPVAAKRLFQLVLEASEDVSIFIILCSTILSLVSGVRKDGWKVGWYNGIFIFLNMIAIIMVTAICNFRQSKLFDKQSNEGKDTQVFTIRAGERKKVSVSDIVVGDIVVLKIGVHIPADGLLLPVEPSLLEHDGCIMVEEDNKMYIVDQLNPFLSLGKKVMDAHSYHYQPKMLVTAVGSNTWGISRQANKRSKTYFQEHFTKLTSYKETIGMIISLILLLVSSVDCFSGSTNEKQNPLDINAKKTTINEVITASMTFVKERKVGLKASAATAMTFLLAIPEGLSLVVTLLLIDSRRRLMKSIRVKVQKLFPFINAGYVTTIVTNKRSFLMVNRMEVTRFSLGEEVTDALMLPPKILAMLCQGICLNTSSILLSSPDEEAILSWAETHLHMKKEDMRCRSKKEDMRCRSTVLYVEARNPVKKGVGVWIRKTGEDGKASDVHWKGSAKMMLARCSHYYEKNGIREFTSKEKRLEFEKIIEDMETGGLKCMAFAHAEVIEGAEGMSTTGVTYPSKIEGKVINEHGLTLLGIVGLEYQCHPKAKEAVKDCREAGINVVMVSQDTIFAANALATKCGILGDNTDRMVIEAEEFRSCADQDKMEIVDKICVMASSTPADKLLMVQYLKQKGHVVAYVGISMSDAPVLEEADLWLSMSSVQIVNEISDIVIMNNNPYSMTTILRWGRCTHENIQKFIQFNLTFNIAALVINFIATVALGEEAPFTMLQMLLLNLVMDCVGAFALAYELPTKQFMKPLIRRSKTLLVTNVMWRNIVAQASFQILIVLTLQFKGKAFFAVDENLKKTLAFNTFVLCQYFNLFNSRKLEEKNIFSGLHQNMLFWVAAATSFTLQVAVTELLGKIFNLERLTWTEWGSCIAMAAVSWPVGFITKCIAVPDSSLQNLSYHSHFTRLACLRWASVSKWIEELKLHSRRLPLVTKDAHQIE